MPDYEARQDIQSARLYNLVMWMNMGKERAYWNGNSGFTCSDEPLLGHTRPREAIGWTAANVESRIKAVHRIGFSLLLEVIG